MSDIDREVAEKVMGWVSHANGWHYGGVGIAGYVRLKGKILQVLGEKDEAEFVWSPSTRIDHAWEVLNKIIKHDTMMASVNYGPSDWWCTIYLDSGRYIDGEYAKTAPLAICEAALKAMANE